MPFLDDPISHQPEPDTLERCRKGESVGPAGGDITDRDGPIEQEIIERVRAGERDAFAGLVRRHAVEAYRVAVLSGAGPEAEDVVQVAFVKAYQNLRSFRSGSSFRPWLLRIVVNEARNSLRAARRRGAVSDRMGRLRSDGLPAEHLDPAVEILSQERYAVLLDCLDHLPESQRQVVVCRYLLDLDERETAAVLGWPRGTVKSRLHRALGRLRRWLDDVDVPDREVEHET